MALSWERNLFMEIIEGEESIKRLKTFLNTGMEKDTAMIEKTIDIMGSRILVYG